MGDKQTSGRCKVVGVLFLLVVCCVIVGVVVWQTTRSNPEKSGNQGGQHAPAKTLYQLGGLDLSTETFSLSIKKNSKIVLSGGIGLREKGVISDCSGSSNNNAVCLQWPNSTKLSIEKEREQTTDCFTITWEATSCMSHVLQDCYDIGHAHWYGGYEDWLQPWPFESSIRNLSAFITNDSYQKGIGGVQERYFFSTKGVAIYVEEDVPLYLSWNASGDGRICLVSKYEKYPYLNMQKKLPFLKYHICVNENLKTIHDYMSNRFIVRPTGIPDERLFRYPIWSTWAQYHKDINQSIVLEFAENILQYNFPHSQIEIDDDWTPKYGDMDFNTDKFPNAADMVRKLTALGFRATVWLHPFFNLDSRSFTEAAEKRYLIRQLDSELPSLVSWWDGKGAGLLDVSNPEAVDWYLNKTKYLRNTYNISSFKFDAGEAGWLPNAYSSKTPLDNPSLYSQKYAELAYRSDINVRHQEIRVGFKNQHLPVFVRMLDKDTNWNYTNGLKTLIPTALTFSVLGYPFILPDMIAGNAYNNKPTKEIFIRWLQATTFLPSLQFSIVPWQFDEETINLTRYFLQLHENYTDTIISLANESVSTGAPIIRPLWWIDPDDDVAQSIDSEFLVGNSILVAPVLDEGSRKRDVYLPRGRWVDKLRNIVTDGPTWLRQFAADLHELPYFELVS